MTSVGEDVEKQSPSCMLVEMKNGVAALGDSLVLPEKVKPTVTI